MQGRERILLIQATITLAICLMATVASMYGESVSGDALVGLYGVSIGYIWGYQSGSRAPNGNPLGA